MADTITPEGSSNSSPLNSSSRIICRVCQKQFSQYTCPRCNVRYCSLSCYKSHSLRCTESFMRENVMEELQQVQQDDRSKQKMLEILKRIHSEDEADVMGEDAEPESLLSEATIEKVLSGNDISFDDLSAEERKHFQRAVTSGELSKLIEPWEPWWLKPAAKNISLGRDGTQLVRPLVSEDAAVSSEDCPSQDLPLGPDSPLPSVNKLSAAKPSPLLFIHLVDVVYSYCFTLRLHNGDWQSDPIGSTMVLLSVSSVLGQGGQPETLLEALSHCLEQTCSPTFRHMGGLQFALGLVNDTITLLHVEGPALVCLLCDLRRLIQHAEKDMKSEKKPCKSRRSEMKTKLKSAERKVYFLMCWAHEQPREAWSSLAAVLEVEKSRLVELVGSKTTLPKGEKVQNEGKPLIKEV